MELKWGWTTQRKFRADIEPETILKCGAYRSSHAFTVQEFLDRAGSEWCIRKEETDEFLYSQTGEREEFQGGSRVEKVGYGLIDGKESKTLKRKYGVRTRVFKTRTVYYFEEFKVHVNVDSIAFLGNFVEIRGEEEGIVQVQQLLGLRTEDLVDPSYFELMLERKASPFEQRVVGFYYHTQDLTFGIVSGVLTAVAITMGMAQEAVTKNTHEAMAWMVVFLALITLAFGDSLSDALGFFRQEWLKWGGSFRSAIKGALSTLVGKVGMPLLFAAWFLLVPFNWAILGTIGSGTLVLGGHAYGEAIMQQRSRFWHPVLMLAISSSAVILTRVITLWIATWVQITDL